MIRLIFWCFIGYLLYVGLRRLQRGQLGASTQSPAGQGAAEDIVRCRTCGLNVPKSEAIASGGLWACCAEHARQADPAARS